MELIQHKCTHSLHAQAADSMKPYVITKLCISKWLAVHGQRVWKHKAECYF
jgi:hypothetical protein